MALVRQTIFREINEEIPFQISKLIIKTAAESILAGTENCRTPNTMENMREPDSDTGE